MQNVNIFLTLLFHYLTQIYNLLGELWNFKASSTFMRKHCMEISPSVLNWVLEILLELA